MRRTHFHSFRRDRPQAFFEVYFLPGGTPYFAGAGSGQHGELNDEFGKQRDILPVPEEET
jgi:hypothetical protein